MRCDLCPRPAVKHLGGAECEDGPLLLGGCSLCRFHDIEDVRSLVNQQAWDANRQNRLQSASDYLIPDAV